MFNDLRKKLIIMNMSIISTILLCSFICIYVISYSNQNKINIDHLNKSSLIIPNHRPTIKEMNTSFNIIVKNNKIDKVISPIEIDENSLINITNKAINSDEKTDKIKIDGSTWLYKKNYKMNNEIITFIDISESVSHLNFLLIILIIIWFIMLILVYFVSLYFTNKSLSTAIETYNKQKQFIEDATHELKTPVAVIKANTDALLINDNDKIKNQIKWINYIKNETISMEKLINDLLISNKTENEVYILNKENLSNYLNEIILSMESFIYEKNIKLTTKISDNIYSKIDKDKFKQLVTILIDNGIKYNNNKRILKINLYKEKSNTYLEFINTSDPIEEKELEKLFDRFYKIDKARTNSNSYGLGLSIAKNIITKFKWNINVTNNTKETKFKIKLNN